MTSVVLKVTRISLCVWVCSENMSWLFCFEQWQLGDVLCFLSDRDRQVNRSCLELGAVFFFLVSSWIDFWFEQSCSCQIQAEALQPIGALRFFLYYFFNKELWTMLLLCTNRALECLHVQPHILLSISYRIITHSKHDAWSELHALKVWTVPAVAVLELSHLAEKENSWTPIGWACKITVTLYSVRSSENLAFV